MRTSGAAYQALKRTAQASSARPYSSERVVSRLTLAGNVNVETGRDGGVRRLVLRPRIFPFPVIPPNAQQVQKHPDAVPE